MNINFDTLACICPYCQLKHRDGEWLDVCEHPIFLAEAAEEDDILKCLEETCPLNKYYGTKEYSN